MSENHVENALEENRNTLMLVGYLHANQKQNQQLKALGEQLEMQTKLAATEESRLKLERQRLALEQERIAALKTEAAAVKALRRILVDIGSDIQQLQSETKNRAFSNGVNFCMSGKLDRNLILQFASVQAKLAVVASSGDVLSDLNDLKEVRKFETDLAELITVHYKSGSIPQNPLASLDVEVDSLFNWGNQVQNLVDYSKELLSPEQLIEEGQKAGINKMQTHQLKIEKLHLEILSITADLRSKIPKYYLNGNVFDKKIVDYGHLRFAAGAKKTYTINLSDVLKWLGRTEEEQDAIIDLKGKLTAHINLIQKLCSEANAQSINLDEAMSEFEKGNLNDLKRIYNNRFDENRYYDLQDRRWSTCSEKIEELESLVKDIENAESHSKIIKAVNLFNLNDGWRNLRSDSELGLELNRIKKSAIADRLQFWFFLGVIPLLSLLVWYEFFHAK